MKKILTVLLVILSIIIIWSFVDNAGKDTTSQLDKDIFEPDFFKLEELSQTESVPIMNNTDPGRDPAQDYFGDLGTLLYPLKNLDILDDDEILIIFRPSDAVKTEKIDAYVAFNTEKIQQSKDEFCYFQTSKGTTPVFYVSIYKNGVAITEETGIFGAHLSHLTDEFKAVCVTRTQG